ncbi:hypothetical protein PAAG_12662 [Paracoccidioides lutzii Pb01]|uniref:Uncharacterized protein n=1 Tax=Paracoccidioides lutzii (strain ATCC MYA-826 / Pb01) TaxID=502779 RepID=A0A0A2V2V8_PARBA|nr:hypothetical protein PAAG_12662 [Paracoccidioides lutzii Pb01]KGQ00672.1 hypothetical protein PAAG_12662 [Paracoccidioides lutzii Pb01]
MNHSRLLSQEPKEVQKLLRCCQSSSFFFYLDLQDIDGRRIMGDKEALLKATKRIFNSPIKKKMGAGHPLQNHGYCIVHFEKTVKQQLKNKKYKI